MTMSDLVTAAGDRHLEAKAMPKLLRSMGRHFRKNGSTKLSPFQRFMQKVAFGLSDCWYWCGSQDHTGYGRTARIEGEYFAHRASWRLFHGTIPRGLKVLHRCDVPNCVNPEHLFLGTQAENVADMVAKGRNKSVPLLGERNPMSRLTAAQVQDIREEYARCRTSMSELASRYGVATMTICRAINRKTWSH